MIARCFLGGVPEDAHERWLKLCREAVEAVEGLPALEKVYLPGRFGSFAKGLRPDEVAVLPGLIALNERPTDRGLKPGAAFLLRLAAVTSACLYIMDVDAGLTSRDGQRWIDHAEATHRRVTNGRSLRSKKASEMAKRKNQAKPGLVARWKTRAFAEDRDRMCVIWTSRAYENAAAAVAAIGREFPELAGVSETTIERIAEVGRTGRPIKRATQR